MSNLLIRPVQPAELELLRRFAEQTFRTAWQDRNEAGAFEEYCRKAFSPERIAAEYAETGTEFYFARDGDTLAAYLKLNPGRTPSQWNDGPAFQLERIYVAPGLQSRGLGAALMTFVENRARQTGARWLWLTVWEHSPRGIAFYEKNGFEIFGVETFQLGSEAQQDWLMRKEL